MHIVLLLIVGIAIAYFSRPKNKQSYQIAILAIIGFAYFCIWRFIEFYTVIFLTDNNLKNIAFFLLVLSAVLIALLPWVKDISRVHAIMLAGILTVCLVLTFYFEKKIKNSLAIWCGYFTDPTSEFTNSVIQADALLFHHESGGFSFKIPARWHKKTHSSGLNYFEFEKGVKHMSS